MKKKEAKINHGMLIDSPGYGHTYVPVKVKNQFRKLMTMYLSHAVRLNLVLMLVDAKTGLKTSDRDMLDKLHPPLQFDDITDVEEEDADLLLKHGMGIAKDIVQKAADFGRRRRTPK